MLHIRDDAGLESRLQAACDIARACDAHIRCVQVTALPDLVAGDFYGGAALAPGLIEELHEADEALKARMEDRLRREGVQWDWRHRDGDIVSSLLFAARLVDMMIVSLPMAERRGYDDPLPIAGDLVLGGRTPVLGVPVSARSFPVGGRAVIAWDGSKEASAALTSAVPLLSLAADVHVVTVEETGKGGFPATDAPEYLARHGITSDLQSWPRDGEPVDQVLAAAIHGLRPDWIVMGAYGHSRLRETIFGGTTRAMLKSATVPLFLAH